jgi:hypothetical protein
MRFIPTRIHAYLDYLFGAVLIAAPWLFGFANGGAAQWVPVVIGAAGIAYSLFSDHEVSVSPAIPMSTHLWIDVAVGLVLAASPWIFNFADFIAWPHVLIGLFAVVAGLTTETRRRDPALSATGATTTRDTTSSRF